MAQKPLIAVESAVESASTVRKDAITATPSQVAGHAATQLLNESPGATWRTATDNPDDCQALVPLDETRHVGAIQGVGHNLRRHGCWATAVGTTERPAVRPVWSTDGVDDTASTGVAISDSADITICGVLRLPPQPIGLETAFARLFQIENGAAGRRAMLRIRSGAVGSPYQLDLIWDNYGTFAQSIFSVYPAGQWLRFALVHDDSANSVKVWINGVLEDTITTLTSWSDTGDTRLRLSSSGVALYAAAEWASFAIYGLTLSDADAAAWTGDTMDGDEYGLVWGCNFADGSGSTATDVTGTSDLTLTGGTWLSRWSPYAAYSLDTTVWGPWSSRQGVVTATTTDIASPVISTAPRSITQAFVVTWPEDAPRPATGIGPYAGPTAATAEMSFEFLSSGLVRVRSLRGGDFTVTSTTDLRDGAPHFVRAVLDGNLKTLTLYIGAPGTAEASEGTPATVGAYDALASCKAGIGNGSTSQPGLTISDLRVYSRVLLEADDPLSEDAPAWRSDEVWAHVRFDGQVVDGADTSRTYSGTSGLTYRWIDRSDAHGGLERADRRRNTSTEDPFASYPHRLLARLSADVEADEVAIRMDDRGHAGDATNGYLKLASLYAAATLRPGDTSGLLLDGRRISTHPLPVGTTQYGGRHLSEGARQPDGAKVTLQVLSDRAGHTAPTPSLHEVMARLYGHPRALLKLRAIWLEAPAGLAQHRWIEYVVVGNLEGDELARQAANTVMDLFEIDIRGVAD